MRHKLALNTTFTGMFSWEKWKTQTLACGTCIPVVTKLSLLQLLHSYLQIGLPFLLEIGSNFTAVKRNPEEKIRVLHENPPKTQTNYILSSMGLQAIAEISKGR